MVSLNFNFRKWLIKHKITGIFFLTIILLTNSITTASAVTWIYEDEGTTHSLYKGEIFDLPMGYSIKVNEVYDGDASISILKNTKEIETIDVFEGDIVSSDGNGFSDDTLLSFKIKSIFLGQTTALVQIDTLKFIKNDSFDEYREENYDLLWNYETIDDDVRSVSVSSDGSYIAMGSEDTNVYFFDRGGKILWNYDARDYVYSVSVSSDGSYVAAGSNDDIYYFNNEGKLLWKYKTDDNINSVSVSSNGSYVVAGSNDDNVYFLNREGNLLWKYKTGGDVKSIFVSSDDSYIAVGSEDTNVYLLNKEGKLLWSYKTNGNINSVSVSSDGSYVAAGSDDDNVYFFDLKGKLLWKYKTSGDVKSASVSSDGSYIAAGSANIDFFNREGKLLWSYKTGGDVNIVSVSSDGSYISMGTNDDNIYFFNMEGKILWKYETNSNVNSVSISSDDSSIAAGSMDNKVYFFQNVEILAKEAITEAKGTISKVKSENLDIVEAESLLSKAEQVYSSGDYNGAKSLAEQANIKVKEIVQIGSSAKTALDNAKSAISQEKVRGFNVAEAEALLSKAEQAYNSGDYTSAKSRADQAKAIAIDVDFDGVSNNEDFAPTIQNNYIYGSAFLALIFLIIGTKTFLKSKASKKDKLRQEARSAISSFSGGQSDYKSGALYSEAKTTFDNTNYSKVKKIIKEAEELYKFEIEIVKDIESIRDQIPQGYKNYFKETDIIINKSLKALKEGKSKDVGRLVSDAKYVFKEELKVAKYENEKDDLINEMDDSLK